MRKIVYWLPVILYASLIFYMSSKAMVVQPQELVGLPMVSDKLLHVAEYFVFSWLLLRALKNHDLKNPFFWAFAIAALYGISDEVHQLFVPGRSFSFLDMAANAVGASLVLSLKKLIPRILCKHK